MSTEEIYNFLRVSEQVLTGGQPTEGQLGDAAAEGVRAVVNLATYQPGHSLTDEEGVVRSLEMDYYWIPVGWTRPTAEDYHHFERVLLELGDVKVLIHCMANYRATAFYSLYARNHLGWSEEQSKQLRSMIWLPGQYPVWDEFIRKLTPGATPHDPPGS